MVFFSIRSSKKKFSTLYDILNLKPGCTKKEIRNSFIKLSKLVFIWNNNENKLDVTIYFVFKNHPDVCGPSSNDRFIRINEAYTILMDDDKKNLYDETLRHNNNIQHVYNNYPRQQGR